MVFPSKLYFIYNLMNTSNIKTGFIFQWSGFSVIFILKPLKLVLFHYCGVYILKGFSRTPYFSMESFSQIPTAMKPIQGNAHSEELFLPFCQCYCRATAESKHHKYTKGKIGKLCCCLKSKKCVIFLLLCGYIFPSSNKHI